MIHFCVDAEIREGQGLELRTARGDGGQVLGGHQGFLTCMQIIFQKKDFLNSYIVTRSPASPLE